MQYSVHFDLELGTSTSTSPQGKVLAEGQLIPTIILVIKPEIGHFEYLRLLDLRLSIEPN